MHRRPFLILLALVGSASSVPAQRGGAASGAQSGAPSGAQVLQRMHDAYAGKWYRTLTFTQKTTRRRPDGTEAVTMWLESLRYTPEAGVQLRIDIGDLSAGRGVIYTADSSWSIQNGKLAGVRADGNEFLPLIEGVYVQPIARTIEQVSRHGFNLSNTYRSTIDGQPVWVVGASTPDDTMSLQFAVDTTRLVIVRMMLGRGAGQPPLNVKVGGYERVAGGWLATKIDITSNGVPVQLEEYTGWRVDPALPASLFDPAQWTTAPHWARVP